MGLFFLLSSSWLKPQTSLKFIVFVGHVDGPGELLTLGFVVDLLHGDAPLLTPETHTGREEGFRRV